MPDTTLFHPPRAPPLKSRSSTRATPCSGSPVVFDLRDDPTTLAWSTDKVMGIAPVGTTKVRVRVSALNMVDNCCALGQDVMFDNFRLSDNVVPAANRLSNGDLNIPGAPAGWTVTEGPTVDQGNGPVTADSLAFIGFANRQNANPNLRPPPVLRLANRACGCGLSSTRHNLNLTF